MFNKILKDNNGFTLIELLISISIITMIASISFLNFREGEKKTQLNLSANLLLSEIRKVQNMVLSGSSFNNQDMPLGGYGFHFSSNEYIIFSDDQHNKILDELDSVLENSSLINISI